MKLFLKEVVYFEITVPDGTNRETVTNVFRTDTEKAFKRLIKNIALDEADLRPYSKLLGDNVSIRLVTEREALNQTARSSVNSVPFKY